MIDIRYEDYRITADSNQWKLQEYRGKDKHEKDLWLSVGYYSTLTGAHKGLYQRLLRKASATTIQELDYAAQRIAHSLRTAIEISADIDTLRGQHE